ncbi:IS3 family transposase [Empedobacter sp. 225-1]|nr:IS3 family transposase [Empedobacter sp. 225-1]MDM1544022.1 IS3 family transposase [Empedobacter sp. 189-2]
MKKSRKNYSLEFKLKTLELLEERGCSMTSLGRELGVNPENIKRWSKDFKSGKLTSESKIKEKSKEELEIIRLNKELAHLKLEHEILKKAGKHLFQERQVKYRFIESHTTIFPVEKMCKVLKVSRSSYYKWLVGVPSKRALYNQMLSDEIKRIYTLYKGRYGSPRIAKELESLGIKVSKQRVARLMKKHALRSILKRKFKVTTDSSHKYPVVENHLNRNFTVEKPNSAWVSDITYIRTKQSWLYLTTVIDLFDRKVIGWSVSSTMYAKDTSITAFKMALINRPLMKTDSLIFHSDRGVQYACKEFCREVERYKLITRSMSRKGNCWDNAVAESFFKTLKMELIYQNRYQTRKEAKLSIFEYIEGFYNTHRRHKFLENRTILEFNQFIINKFKIAA